MGIAVGALLSAAAGFGTGLLMARLRSERRARSATWLGIAGAFIGGVGYGLFLLLGCVVSIITFGSAVEPLPALLGVLIGCICVLAVAWLQSFFPRRFGLPPRPKGQRRDVSDLLDAQPVGGPATMWIAGVLLALLPAYYGVECLVTLKGSLGRTFIWRNTVEGGGAIALGLGWLGVAAFLHFHFFHGLHPSLQRRSRTGKLVAIAVACVGLTVAAIWSMVAKASQ